MISETESVEVLDVPYVAQQDAKMAKLDIYFIPNGQPKKVMVFIHGGSWTGGDKRNLKTKAPKMLQWFLKKDFVVFAPNFRLASKPNEARRVTYKEQATDIAQALAWVKKHRSEYGIGQEAMLLVGYSSGAHLVALLTTDSSYLHSVGLSFQDIQAAISLDVHAYDVPLALRLMQGSVIERNIPLILSLFGETKAEQLKASPAFYVSKSPLPPRLVISVGSSASVGSRGYITAQTAKAFVQRLLGFEQTAVWRHYDDENHPSLVLDFGTEGDLPTQAVEHFIETLKYDQEVDFEKQS